MENIEQEKRKHSIVDWTLTIAFALGMITIIFTMKGFMSTHRELFLSAVLGLIALFAFAKIRLAKWSKRLSKQNDKHAQ